MVKNIDSDNICPLIAPGVAPKALLIPISFVRSLTTISMIFEIPITPEIKTNVPTKYAITFKILNKLCTLLNCSYKSKFPTALSSVGFIECNAFIISKILGFKSVIEVSSFAVSAIHPTLSP
ncbi:hypothetical protein D9M72_593400 [compost metagenome]